MIVIALPLVVSNACDTIMIFTDRIFLSRLDPHLMNASLGGGVTAFMMMSFFVGLLGYTTALVAQYMGARHNKNCALVITQAMLFALCAYPLILAAVPLVFRLYEAMAIDPAQLAPQKVFLSILVYGVIFNMTRTCLSGFFSGIGRTGIVMVAAFVAMVTNVMLDYCLIFGKFGFPQLGIKGAGIATVSGGIAGAIVLATAYLGKKNRREFGLREALRFDRVIAGKLLRYGSSTGTEMFLNLMAFNMMVMLFQSHSQSAATAATIMFNWDLVSFVPLIGVEIGVTSMVGRFMGAGDPVTAHKSTLSGLKLGLIYSAMILFLFLALPLQLANVFRPETGDSIFLSSLPTAVFMLRTASIYVLAEAVLMVFIGALRGAGDTFWAMSVSVSLHWLTMAILFVLLRVLHLSAEAGWAAMVIFFLVFSVIVYLRYRGGKWRTLRVVQAAH
jgi:MATE family multidrug resistance protein